MAKQSAYYEIDGQKLIRVTSVLGQTLAKPALFNWAKKATREGAAAYLEGQREQPITDDIIKRPDLTNYQKAAEDALTGLLYQDDSQVVMVHSGKRYTDEAEGYTHITVAELEEDR